MSTVGPQVLDKGTVVAQRFEVTGEVVGQGSSGVVLAALDRTNGKEVVLKLLHEHLADEPEEIRQLRVAAGAASRLQHRHVNPVIGLFDHEGRWVLVSERVRGRTLDEAAATALPVDAGLAFAVQLADALAATHAAGIVHGDLRPETVLVGPSGVQLFGYGLASTIGLADHEAARDRRPGVSAPEVHQGAPPGRPADLYGLGVVLFRALTGEMPFHGDSAWSVINRQGQGPPDVGSLPRGVGILVRSLLQPDPARRPTDAAAVRDALSVLQRDPDKVVRPTWRWVPPVRPRRNWAVRGIDPHTGGPALLAADLSKGGAASLARRLRGHGWEATAVKEGLGGRDLAAILAPAAVAGVLLPVVGGLSAAAVIGLALSSGCNPNLRDALPARLAPLPVEQAGADRGAMVAIGLLMLFTALWLVLFPPIGLVAATLLALVVYEQSRNPDRDAAEAVQNARTVALLADARMTMDAADLDLDDLLSRHGELDALEASWRGGDSTTQNVRERAQALIRDLPSAQRLSATTVRKTADALAAARAEVSETDSAP